MSTSRTARFVQNTLSTAVYQITAMIMGFITPRLMILYYGSEVNGLIVSVTEFLTYFKMVESGLAAAAYAAAGQEKSLEDCAPYPLELAAKAGDPVALAMWDDIARKLATGLLSCHYILNPAAFIIGGGVAKAGDLLFEPLHRYLKAQTYGPHYEKLRILPAQFSNEAGIIGAAKMALEEAESRGKA